MIDLLLAYAREHELVTEPGFAPKNVKWALAVDPTGRFLEVLPLGDTSLKNNPGQRFARCPDLTTPELNVCRGCHYLVETALVVALFKLDSLTPSEVARVRRKHDFFVDLLRQSAGVVPELGLVAGALTAEATLQAIGAALASMKVKHTDSVTLYVGGKFVLDDHAWHDWWRNWRSRIGNGRKPREARDQMVCFGTGETVTPVATLPQVKGLSDVGGSGMGVSLVAFDKSAFRSFGLEQSANAAMSVGVATAYRAALNDLLESHSARVAAAKITHWFDRAIPPEDDILADLIEPSAPAAGSQTEAVAQHKASALLNAIRAGARPDLAQAEYFALTLSGNAARVVVRDWMTGRFEQLVSAVRAWFDDLAITRFNGRGLAAEPGMERVVTALLRPRAPRQKYDEWIQPAGSARVALWRAAVQEDRGIPHAVIGRIMSEHVSFVQTAELEHAIDNAQQAGLMISLLHARMGLLRAYHVRNGDTAMECYLNDNHPDPAYHCGRLMAVYARLQRSAQGDLGADVIQRFYAAASSTPALVLGRLSRLSQFHLNKLEPGLAHWYQERIAGIACRVKDGMPRSLSIQEQSVFALGYYHQLAHDWPRRKQAEQAGPDHGTGEGDTDE